MKKHLKVVVCLLALLPAGIPIPTPAQTPEQTQAQTSTQTTTQNLERVIPEGTEIQLSLAEPLSSKLNDVGDVVFATIRRDVAVDGRTVLPKGAEVSGRVTLAQRAGRPFKGGKLHITFDRVRLDGQEQKLAVVIKSASDFARDEKIATNSEGTLKEGTSGGDLLKNVLTAAGIGGIGVTIAILAGSKNDGGYYRGIGGGGAIAGASILGASVVVGVLLTKGKEVRLDSGAVIRVRLERPFVVG